MRYVDYNWDLSPDRIVFDNELNIDALGWKGGDHFKLVNIDGVTQLVKLDPLLTFIKGYTQNDNSD
jgi:hypothetical protein